MQENNNMTHLKLLIFFSFISFFNFSQEQPLQKPKPWKGDTKQTSDTTSLLYAFKNGDIDGRIRGYSSLSINDGTLTDFYANALGAGLRYETKAFHGFQLAMSGFATFNLASSDLSIPDPTTNNVSRYELGLFDVANPGETQNLAQNEELYLKYNLKKLQLIFGRQFLHTPLLNLQDGRMRPTTVEGLWYGYAPSKKWKFEGGWLYRIFPRSTNKWYRIDESMGLYPQGRNTNGQPANYLGNLSSNGLGIFSVNYKPAQGIDIQVWDYYLDNIINSAFIQVKGKAKVKDKFSLLYGGQFMRQDAINDGGNSNPDLSYTERGAKSMTFGGTIGMQKKAWIFALNYNRITKHGKFLFPREWGRDPFFTFLPRERNEGFGDVHAVSAQVKYNPKESPFFASLGAGYYDLPDILEQKELNKYAIPAYFQVNLDLKYKHEKWLKGLESHLLVVSKIAEGNTYDNPRFVFQKVNLLHVNLMLNYYF
jgi:hypothetical protein